MRIFIKQNKELDRVIHKKIAPLSARNDLQDNIRRERANVKNAAVQDKGQAQKEAEKWENTYEKNAPETLSPEAKNAMWKRAKALKDEFTIGMLTTDELHPVSKTEKNGVISVVVDAQKMNNANTVRRQFDWNKKNEKAVREYKNIMRHLCPDNPDATDVEKFRGHGGIR